MTASCRAKNSKAIHVEPATEAHERVGTARRPSSSVIWPVVQSRDEPRISDIISTWCTPREGGLDGNEGCDRPQPEDTIRTRSAPTGPHPYLDRFTSGMHLPLEDHRSWRQASIQPVPIPNLAHTGIRTKFSPGTGQGFTPDGTMTDTFRSGIHETVRNLPRGSLRDARDMKIRDYARAMRGHKGDSSGRSLVQTHMSSVEFAGLSPCDTPGQVGFVGGGGALSNLSVPGGSFLKSSSLGLLQNRRSPPSSPTSAGCAIGLDNRDCRTPAQERKAILRRELNSVKQAAASATAASTTVASLTPAFGKMKKSDKVVYDKQVSVPGQHGNLNTSTRTPPRPTTRTARKVVGGTEAALNSAGSPPGHTVRYRQPHRGIDGDSSALILDHDTMQHDLRVGDNKSTRGNSICGAGYVRFDNERRCDASRSNPGLKSHRRRSRPDGREQRLSRDGRIKAERHKIDTESRIEGTCEFNQGDSRDRRRTGGQGDNGALDGGHRIDRHESSEARALERRHPCRNSTSALSHPASRRRSRPSRTRLKKPFSTDSLFACLLDVSYGNTRDLTPTKSRGQGWDLNTLPAGITAGISCSSPHYMRASKNTLGDSFWPEPEREKYGRQCQETANDFTVLTNADEESAPSTSRGPARGTFSIERNFSGDPRDLLDREDSEEPGNISIGRSLADRGHSFIREDLANQGKATEQEKLVDGQKWIDRASSSDWRNPPDRTNPTDKKNLADRGNDAEQECSIGRETMLEGGNPTERKHPTESEKLGEESNGSELVGDSPALKQDDAAAGWSDVTKGKTPSEEEKSADGDQSDENDTLVYDSDFEGE